MLVPPARMEPFRILQSIARKAFSEKYLLATNVTIALVLCSFGDILEQYFELRTPKSDSAEYEISNKNGNGNFKIETVTVNYDFVRTRNMGLSGCLVDVICHYWYQFLERHMPEHTFRAVVKKIILDQLICTPIYIIAFFIAIGILEDESPQQIWGELRTKAWNLYLVECMIWPVAQFINFYWLPNKYRLLYDNIFALGFDVYTSRVKHFDGGDVYTHASSSTEIIGKTLLNRINQSIVNLN